MTAATKKQLKQLPREELQKIKADAEKHMKESPNAEDYSEAKETADFIETLLGAPPEIVPAKEESELERLRRENAELKSAQSKTNADEALILKKMARGLTRDQAIASIKNQARFVVTALKRGLRNKEEAK